MLQITGKTGFLIYKDERKLFLIRCLLVFYIMYGIAYFFVIFGEILIIILVNLSKNRSFEYFG